MKGPIEQFKLLERKRENPNPEKLKLFINEKTIPENRGIFFRSKESNSYFNSLTDLSIQIQAIEKININSQEYEEDVKYFSSTFNSDFLGVIETFLRKNKKNKMFKKKFIQVIRNLRMNEFEFSAFTLVLDLVDFININLNDFYFIGLETLKLTRTFEKVERLIRKYEKNIPDFQRMYDSWKKKFGNLISEDNLKEFLTSLKIVQRICVLTEENNKYCFLEGNCNYNGMVKKIIEIDEQKKNKKEKKIGKKAKNNVIETKKEKENELNKKTNNSSNNMKINEPGNEDSEYKINNYILQAEPNNFQSDDSYRNIGNFVDDYLDSFNFDDPFDNNSFF